MPSPRGSEAAIPLISLASLDSFPQGEALNSATVNNASNNNLSLYTDYPIYILKKGDCFHSPLLHLNQSFFKNDGTFTFSIPGFNVLEKIPLSSSSFAEKDGILEEESLPSAFFSLKKLLPCC